MSVRIIARIRPLLKSESEGDIIVRPADHHKENEKDKERDRDKREEKNNVVRIPNPKNPGEDFRFEFCRVYGGEATQLDVFEGEVAPTVKHLFNGFDVTLFAYGVTGTGKTHTMRGGKALADRGVIPRLLSGIYRRSRKLAKDSKGETSVEVMMSYYEIYNDKVFDLFEAPEKRTLAGLQLRDNGGKTVVVGLTERPCESLKEFENLYDQANVNRSTSATKLNAHSSRSHAVLCVKVTVMTAEEVRASTASAIDLAGSEDNRRTDNGKERLVESASINKSLFVLAQCVEAISKKQSRIPYRESKMTRILSLGQNNGLTIMILNLAPIRSYHQDTLSSLNFANRTKRIEVREVENEPVFKGCPRAVPTVSGSSLQRQPLRPLAATVHNSTVHAPSTVSALVGEKKPAKAFSVYSDHSRQRNSIFNSAATQRRPEGPKRSSPLKRPLDNHLSSAVARPSKFVRTTPSYKLNTPRDPPTISQAKIEDLIEKKVSEILAAKALDAPTVLPVPEISEEVQRRLDLLERKIEGKDDARTEGLNFLLMAKQHAVRGEDGSALRMYELAKSFFPENGKLQIKIDKLREKIMIGKGNGVKERVTGERAGTSIDCRPQVPLAQAPIPQSAKLVLSSELCILSNSNDEDESYHEEADVASDASYASDASFKYKPTKHKGKLLPIAKLSTETNPALQPHQARTLLDIINSRDVSRIKTLKGVGLKKAEAIVEAIKTGDAGNWEGSACKVYGNGGQVESLDCLRSLRGVGQRTVEGWMAGLEDF